MRAQYAAKWGVHLMGMNFQTRSRIPAAGKGCETKMGVYLNSTSAYGLFRRDYESAYFVDKSSILAQLAPLVETDESRIEKSSLNQEKGQKYVAITRPRRFGKTVMANMIVSYFGKGADSRSLFSNLNAARYDWFEEHLNRHNVIHIMFNEMPDEVPTFSQYITRIKSLLLDDLMMAYPNITIRETDAVWDVLKKCTNTVEVKNSSLCLMSGITSTIRILPQTRIKRVLQNSSAIF